MEIQYGDIYCQIVDGLSHLPAIAIIKEVCRARPQGYQYMPKYKKHMWDGYITLMHSSSKFPTGLLSLVLQALKSRKILYKLTDVRSPSITPKVVKPDILKSITLRDYQLDAVNTLVEATRGVANMATNSGKTEVMAGIIYALNSPKTFVLVHRKELLHQTAERFSMRLNTNDIGLIGDGIWNPKNITVAMIQTLYNDFSSVLKGTKLVMVDECHNASSDSYMEVLAEIPGRYRYGFSGTPLKYDLLSDMKLMSFTGDVIVTVNNQYLIEEGYSAEAKVFTVQLQSDSDHALLNYLEAYKACIVENKERNKRIAELAIKSSKYGVVLILVNRLDHGKRLSKLIPGCVYAHGSKSTEDRREILDNMRKGDGIYCATPIFDEGVDVPAVNTIIMAGGGKSHIKLLQRLGRGLRKKAGDNTLIVYDFIDSSNDHLYKHYLIRKDTYAREGFEITKC